MRPIKTEHRVFKGQMTPVSSASFDDNGRPDDWQVLPWSRPARHVQIQRPRLQAPGLSDMVLRAILHREILHKIIEKDATRLEYSGMECSSTLSYYNYLHRAL